MKAKWVKMYLRNQIAADFEIPPYFKIGSYCIVQENVIIGARVRLRSHVELRPGTWVGDDCYVDSGVKSSGQNRIGNNVTLRYGAIIARGCDIGDGCYICPLVMTNNIDHHGNQIGGAKVGKGCFIGTHAVIGAGITIAPDTVIGACALVTKDITEPGGVWVGVPAKRIK